MDPVVSTLLSTKSWLGSGKLALEPTDFLGVEVLVEEVVGLDAVVVYQGDGGIPALEEAVETLGDEAAAAPQPTTVDQEFSSGTSSPSKYGIQSPPIPPVMYARVISSPSGRTSPGRAFKYLRLVHRDEVAIDPNPAAQLRQGGVEVSDDAVDAEALLAPVIGGRRGRRMRRCHTGVLACPTLALLHCLAQRRRSRARRRGAGTVRYPILASIRCWPWSPPP